MVQYLLYNSNILIIYGLFLSIIYSNLFLSKKTFEYPSIKFTQYPLIYNSMIIIPYNNYKAIHIHHWIIYLIIFIINYYKSNKILQGFSIGLFVQGLQYTDRFIFFCNNPY